METGAATTAAPSSAADGDETQTKIVDPITSLQDAIDGLSLAMFESLRSLRDAVAPESGNLGVAPNQNGNGGNSAEPDDLWHSYKVRDTLILPCAIDRTTLTIWVFSMSLHYKAR